jgi:hypothetical protein
MHHDDVAALRPHAVQDSLQMVKRMKIADRHEHASGSYADGLTRKIFPRRDVELIQFDVRGAAISVRDSLRRGEHAKHDERENQAGDGRAGLGEQVHDRDDKQNHGDQCQA